MGHIDCFSVVSSVIDETTRKYKNIICENSSWKQVIKEFCEIIDNLAERFNGESFDVEVDDRTLEIVINFVCGEILIESHKDEFYHLIKYSNKVSFRRDTDETIQISIRFDGIWTERN